MATHVESTSLDDERPAEVSAAAPRRGRWWPAALMLAAFWAFELSVYSVELAMFTRFISRMVVGGVLFLGFTTRWLTYRQFRLLDRLLALVALFVIGGIAGLMADRSVAGPMLLMMGLPLCMTGWTLWVLVSRGRSLAVQRAGLLAVTVVVFGYFALLRWEGLDGAQRAQLAWRWTPSAEEAFLATQQTSTASSASMDERSALPEWQLRPGDWPDFRGPHRDGVVHGVTLAANWNVHPPHAVWRKRVGPAWSGMIVVDGRLVTQEQRGENEAVVCYDAATGNEIWVQEHDERFSEHLTGAGPRATPTFSAATGPGRIFTLGGKGRLSCLNAADGELLWSHDIAEAAGAEVPQWGYSVSPLVVDDRVVVFAGGKEGRSVLAYDAESGKLAWSQSAGNMTYSSPQLATIQGVRQILMQDNQGLLALSPDSGEVLWQLPGASEMAMPMLQPRVLGETGDVLMSFDPGVALLEVKHDSGLWSATMRWDSKSLKPGFNDYTVYDGHIYGLDDGILCCLDLQTGERKWKKGRYGHGQTLLLADQAALLVLSEKGELAIVSADPRRYDERCRFQAIEGKTWNCPVVVNDRIYVRNAEEMACYRVGVEEAMQ